MPAVRNISKRRLVTFFHCIMRKRHRGDEAIANGSRMVQRQSACHKGVRASVLDSNGNQMLGATMPA